MSYVLGNNLYNIQINFLKKIQMRQNVKKPKMFHLVLIIQINFKAHANMLQEIAMPY